MHARTILEHDPVKLLAGKLVNFDISDELVIRVNEKLRVLESQIKIGALGVTIDRVNARAALVLGHMYRQVEKKVIPLEHLAKAACLKTNKLKELQSKLMHYLQPAAAHDRITTLSRPIAGSKETSLLSMVNESAVPQLNASLNERSRSSQASLSSSSAPQQSILPELSIRLASKVIDPDGCVQAVRRFLEDVHLYARTNVSHATLGLQHDLHRFQVAYEAAAFYHFALMQRKPGERKGRTRTKVAHDANVDMDSQDTLLLRDLENASSEIILAEVKQTLPKIQDWLERLAGVSPESASSTTKTESSRTGSRDRSKRQRLSQMEQTKSSATTEEISMVLGSNPESLRVDTFGIESLTEERRNAAEQWRITVVDEAIHLAKQSLVTARGEEEENLTDDSCLEYAANRIFAKYGLIQDMGNNST